MDSGTRLADCGAHQQLPTLPPHAPTHESSDPTQMVVKSKQQVPSDTQVSMHLCHLRAGARGAAAAACTGTNADPGICNGTKEKNRAHKGSKRELDTGAHPGALKSWHWEGRSQNVRRAASTGRTESTVTPIYAVGGNGRRCRVGLHVALQG
eukprot:scaffold4697_cov277-Prasinococcus_capsulatus_cf.AAC.10